jgi:hypothetical protein
MLRSRCCFDSCVPELAAAADISGPPIGGNDTFTFADPEGPEGPESVTVSVLDNDVDPDGTAVRIAPGD